MLNKEIVEFIFSFIWSHNSQISRNNNVLEKLSNHARTYLSREIFRAWSGGSVAHIMMNFNDHNEYEDIVIHTNTFFFSYRFTVQSETNKQKKLHSKMIYKWKKIIALTSRIWTAGWLTLLLCIGWWAVYNEDCEILKWNIFI